MNILGKCLASLIMLVLHGVSAQAAVINVDPGSYTGKWSVLGQTSQLVGPQAVTIPDGTHTIQVADHNGGRFVIDVSATGVVTSLNTDAASGAGDTLTFNTTMIDVDPTAAYSGFWRLLGVTGRTSGSPRTPTTTARANKDPPCELICEFRGNRKRNLTQSVSITLGKVHLS